MRGLETRLISNIILVSFLVQFPYRDVHAEAGSWLKPLINKLLIGDLWKFNEYCGLNRTDHAILSDDSSIRALYNGSLLKSSLKEKRKSLENLSKIDQIGLRARESLPVICSASSWGHADNFTKTLSDGPAASAQVCDGEIELLLDLVLDLIRARRGDVRSGQRFEPLRWLQLNSFARLPSGPPYNNHMWLGDYEACLKIGQNMFDDGLSSGTRYCYGLYGRPEWNSASGVKSASEGFRIGLCLPDACSTTRAQQSLYKLNHLLKLIHLNDLQYLSVGLGNDTNLGVESPYLTKSQDLQLLDVYCLPQRKSAFMKFLPKPDEKGLLISSLNVFLLIILPLLWVAALVSSSLFKESILRQNNKWLIACFDTKENLLKFWDSKHTIRRLKGLNGIKVLSMIWLMLTHNYLLMVSHSDNLESVRQRKSILSAFILNGQHGVPVFFIISGFLVGHKFFAKNGRDNIPNRQQNYTGMIIQRYLRLAPMYLICYAYIKQFAHLLGHGPLWDYGVSLQSESRQCLKESWLIPILMMANFIPPFTHCIITGWHIANDMQIYFLLPILIYVCRKSRVLGRCLIGISFLLTHYTHIVHWGRAQNFSMIDLSQETFLLGGRVVIDRLSYDYVNPLGRLGTYFLGFLVADLVFQQSKLGNNAKFKDSTLMMIAIVLLLSFFTLLIPDGLKLLLVKDEKESKFIIYPTIRVAVELGWAMTIYCLLRHRDKSDNDGRCSLISRMLAHLACFIRLPVWNVLVKLNYSIMLTHFTVSRWMVQSQMQLVQFTWFGYAQFNLLFLVIVYLVNLLLYILVELPLTRLIKTLVDKSD